jgi:transposase
MMLVRLGWHDGKSRKARRRSHGKNAPHFDAQAYLFKMCGVDLTRIDGIDAATALKVIAEVGPDPSRFPTVKNFTSWLGLCPGTRITGGKRLSGKTKRTANHATQALKMAAASLLKSRSALGAYYRRMCAQLDKSKAITAAAHKLARLICAMLTKGSEYVDRGQDYYEERYQQRVLHYLKHKAEAMGFKLEPIADDRNNLTYSIT